MRILQVMASCAKTSGVAQVMMNYYRNIYEDVTFDFLVFWEKEDSFKEEIESYGGKVFCTGAPRITSINDYAKCLKKFFSEHRNEYDVIHLHELYLSVIVFSLAKKYGIKVRIAHSHTTKLSEKKIKAIRNKILFLGTRFLATQYFACSKAAGIAAFGEVIANGEKFYIIKNAISCKKFFYTNEDRMRIRSELSLGESLVIGNVGRFSLQKNQLFLIDIFNEICKLGIDAKLMLIGDGLLYNEILKRINKYDINEKVLLMGVHNDVGKFLSVMDVFVLPSVFEGLGIVLIEAQSNGLKCIASDVVPIEAKILPSYQTISLKMSAIEWAKIIVDSNFDRCKDVKNYLKKSGYEIEYAKYKLYNLYLKFTYL